jgi:hypothetical protein
MTNSTALNGGQLNILATFKPKEDHQNNFYNQLTAMVLVSFTQPQIKVSSSSTKGPFVNAHP